MLNSISKDSETALANWQFSPLAGMLPKVTRTDNWSIDVSSPRMRGCFDLHHDARATDDLFSPLAGMLRLGRQAAASRHEWASARSWFDHRIGGCEKHSFAGNARSPPHRRLRSRILRSFGLQISCPPSRRFTRNTPSQVFRDLRRTGALRGWLHANPSPY